MILYLVVSYCKNIKWCCPSPYWVNFVLLGPLRTSDNFCFSYNLRQKIGGILVQYGMQTYCKTSMVLKYVFSFIYIGRFQIKNYVMRKKKILCIYGCFSVLCYIKGSRKSCLETQSHFRQTYVYKKPMLTK